MVLPRTLPANAIIVPSILTIELIPPTLALVGPSKGFTTRAPTSDTQAVTRDK